MKTFLRQIFPLFLACLLFSPTLSAQQSKRIKDLQKESAALKKNISESEKLLANTNSNVASQLNRLAILNDRISAQEKLVGNYLSEVSTLSADIAVQEDQLRKLSAELSSCKVKYRRALIYLHRNRLLQNKWTFVLMSKNFRQMYRRMRYAADYSKYLRAQGEAIKKKEETVTAVRNRLQADKQSKDALLSEARTQQNSLETQKADRQKTVNELEKKQKSIKSSIAQQRKKQANLDARIDKLIKEEIAAAEARRKAEAKRRAEEARKKKEAEARAAAKKRGKGNTRKNTGSPKENTGKSSPAPRFEAEDAADRTLSSGFSNNRGRLPVPITGSYAITSRYGRYNVEGLKGVTLDNKGINLTGTRGAQARCVYDGEVTTVANLGGTYTVIVRHGSYYSVYSNLSSVSVRNRQKVSTRQTLGTVAPDASGHSVLQFQLRKKNGNTAGHIDPLPWLAR